MLIIIRKDNNSYRPPKINIQISQNIHHFMQLYKHRQIIRQTITTDVIHP